MATSEWMRLVRLVESGSNSKFSLKRKCIGKEYVDSADENYWWIATPTYLHTSKHIYSHITTWTHTITQRDTLRWPKACNAQRTASVYIAIGHSYQFITGDLEKTKFHRNSTNFHLPPVHHIIFRWGYDG